MKREELLCSLADAIEEVVRPHPTRVAIDGPDAAGKTILAGELDQVLNARGREVIRASSDDFHNPRAVRIRRGSESPEGFYHDSFDYAAMETMLLTPLGPSGDRHYHNACFDLVSDTDLTVPRQTAGSNAILIMDGIFLLRPRLRLHWDYSIFVAVSPETSLARGVARDSRAGVDPRDLRQRYAVRYLPGQQIYQQEASWRDRVNAIVHNEDLVQPDLTWGKRP